MSQASLLPGLLPPLRPDEYLRLRREAAGLSIREAARAFYKRPEHAAEMEAKVRHDEQPGAVIGNDLVVDEIRRAFPFEPDVYRQLRDDPPHRHPNVCRGCGCTRWMPCICRSGEDCTIGEAGTCNACEERAERRQPRRAA